MNNLIDIKLTMQIPSQPEVYAMSVRLFNPIYALRESLLNPMYNHIGIITRNLSND